MAAVLAGGAGAGLCSWSAGARWELSRDDLRSVHLAVPRGMHARRGIRFHRSAPSTSFTTVRGIPVTTPAQTLVDLARVCDQRQLQRAVHEAQVRGICRPSQLLAAMALHPGSRGCRMLARILSMAGGRALPTRSELEDRFLRFLDRRGLPMPETNQRIATPRARFEVDCIWRSQGLVVELDGARYHGTDIAKGRDASRERALTAIGLAVMHVTWHQLDAEADELESDIVGALHQRDRS